MARAWSSLPIRRLPVRLASPLDLQDTEIGSLQLATALDDRYAQELATLSGAATLIASHGRGVASTLPADASDRLTPAVLRSLPTVENRDARASRVRRPAALPGRRRRRLRARLDRRSAAAGMKQGAEPSSLIAIGSFALAAFASVWLARTISRPIDTLSQSLSEMTRVARLRPPGAGDRLLASKSTR